MEILSFGQRACGRRRDPHRGASWPELPAVRSARWRCPCGDRWRRPTAVTLLVGLLQRDHPDRPRSSSGSTGTGSTARRRAADLDRRGVVVAAVALVSRPERRWAAAPREARERRRGARWCRRCSPAPAHRPARQWSACSRRSPLLVGSVISEVLGTVMVFMLLGLGLNIVVGYAGLLDLGYVAFFASAPTSRRSSPAATLNTFTGLRPHPRFGAA